MTTTVEVPESALLAVKHRALESLGEEVCGVILRGEHIAVDNIVKPEQRARRFRMDPGQQMEIWNRWKRDGDIIVYHSHPTGSVWPSDDDKWVITRSPEVTFIIYGVRCDEFAAYRWNGFAIVTVNIKVVEVSTQEDRRAKVTNGPT